jgi:hypothetical protein
MMVSPRDGGVEWLVVVVVAVAAGSGGDGGAVFVRCMLGCSYIKRAADYYCCC